LIKSSIQQFKNAHFGKNEKKKKKKSAFGVRRAGELTTHANVASVDWRRRALLGNHRNIGSRHNERLWRPRNNRNHSTGKKKKKKKVVEHHKRKQNHFYHTTIDATQTRRQRAIRAQTSLTLRAAGER
jgi:hypothetical protein